MTFKYRVIEFFPDKGFGIALCTHQDHERKIVVRDRNVSVGELKIGALVECEIELLRDNKRYSGKDIRVLR
jgi:hypothetical protein